MKSYINIKDQKGAVLVIAIIMLLILSIIGIYAMGSSTIEVKIAGQKKFYDASLNYADAGVQYVREQDTSAFAGITTSPTDCANTSNNYPCPSGSVGNTCTNCCPTNAPNSNFNFQVYVYCLGNSPAPIGSGNGYREGFRAFYYLIQSTGYASGTPSASTVKLEVEGYRIGFAGIY
jgi:type IV pilus assembly protein PilX